jgi:hypothetical protein
LCPWIGCCGSFAAKHGFLNIVDRSPIVDVSIWLAAGEEMQAGLTKAVPERAPPFLLPDMFS